jgi:hypothetical protein
MSVPAPAKPWQRQAGPAAVSAPTALAPADAPKPWELPGAGSTPRACPSRACTRCRMCRAGGVACCVGGAAWAACPCRVNSSA